MRAAIRYNGYRHAVLAAPLGRVAAVTDPIDFEQFLAVDMRVGRVTSVADFPEARNPAWKLTIDFGPEVGVKRSSAQVTNYAREELEGRLVVAVVNFPPRQIGPFMSEVLCLGASDDAGRIILLEPRSDVPLGARIH
jgi:tRNA-binding protein